MLQALLASALHQDAPEEARQHWKHAHEAVQQLTLPRRTQVSLQLAQSAAALHDDIACKRLGRWVLQTAGHRGLRLYGTQARTDDRAFEERGTRHPPSGPSRPAQ